MGRTPSVISLCEMPVPLFVAWRRHLPPAGGKSFHSGGGLGKEGKFRPHSLTAGRNQPITGKLSALAKGSPLGRAGERSEPERVRTESDPLRQRLLALPPPPRGEALAKTEGIALTS